MNTEPRRQIFSIPLSLLLSLAVLLAVSILAATVLRRAGGREATRRRLVSLLPAMALLVFVPT